MSYCTEHDQRLRDSGVRLFLFEGVLVPELLQRGLLIPGGDIEACPACMVAEDVVVRCMSEAGRLEALLLQHGEVTTDRMAIFSGTRDS